MRRGLISAVAALAATLAAAAPAAAVPDCPDAKPVTDVVTGAGTLESVIGDRKGRLFYTDNGAKALMRIDGPGQAPKVLLAGLDKGGGLAWDRDGKLLVGYGNGIVEGAIGNVAPSSGLLKVDPDTGAAKPFVAGLSMANGLARSRSGTVYASDDAGLGIDRVVNGVVEHQWAKVVSSNGLAVSRDGRWLYAAQTFVPAAIQRIDTKTGVASTFYRPGPEDIAVGLDGMTSDERDTLYVAANGGGQVWRVRDGAACALARGLLLPSAVAFGGAHKRGFLRTSLFAVTFSGRLVEIPHARG